jgi:hypothetical protein
MFTLNINTLKLGVFFYFIAYGYYGSVVPKNNDLDVVSFLLTILFSLLFIVYSRFPHDLIDKFNVIVKISTKDLLIFLLIFISALFLFFENLQYSLFSDELSYAKSAHRHALEASFYLSKFDFISDFKAKNLIQTLGVAALIHLYLLWKAIDKNKYIPIVIVFFIAYRFIFDLLGGNANPHPPLELITILTSGSFFGISNLGLKLSYFFTYFLFHLLIYLRVRLIVHPINAAILVMTVAAIPVIFQLALIIEHAVWGYFFVSLILIELIRPEGVKLHKVVPLIAIGVLFRQSILVLILPILMLYVWQNGLSSIYSKKNYLSFFTLIIAIPIFLNSLVNGTPVTSNIEDISFTSSLDTIFNYNFMLDSFKSEFSLIWVPIFIFAFIPENKKNITSSIVIFFSYLILYFTYHLIDSDAWDISKYKVEYIAPFLLLGIVKSIKFFEKITPKYFLFATLVLFILINYISNRPVNHLHDVESCHELTTYNYEEAYKYVLENGYSRSTYSIGATYGILPELISGYSISELKDARQVYKSVIQEKITHPVTTNEINKIFDKTAVEYILVPRNLVLNHAFLADNLNFVIIFGDINSAYCGELFILKKQ